MLCCSQQVLNRAIHLRLAPVRAQATSSSHPGFYVAQAQWFAITTTTMIAALIIANIIPYFDIFVSLMGALFSAPLSFLFPVVLYLVLGAHQSARRALPTGSERRVRRAAAVGLPCRVLHFLGGDRQVHEP